MAAQAGAAAEAEEVIEDMRAAGLAPGPRAYHGLIFSHSKVTHPGCSHMCHIIMMPPRGLAGNCSFPHPCMTRLNAGAVQTHIAVLHAEHGACEPTQLQSILHKDWGLRGLLQRRRWSHL